MRISDWSSDVCSSDLPMPVNVSDGFVILKPEDQWPEGVDTKDEVIERIEEAVSGLLGQVYEVSQPIELRFNELISGVRGDVAIKLYGDDLDKMSDRKSTRLNSRH